MMTPINGDLVISHHTVSGRDGQFVVKMHADTGDGCAYPTYDAAFAAASHSAAAAVVNVFYWETPKDPILVKQYRAL